MDMNNIEKKVIAILEARFSLHEADELFNMIFDNEVDEDDVVKRVTK